MSTASASSQEGSSNRNRNNSRRRGGGGNQNRGPQNRGGGNRQGRNRRRRKPEPPKPKTFGEKVSAFFSNLFGGGESKPSQKLGRQPQSGSASDRKRTEKPSSEPVRQPKPRRDAPRRQPETVEITTERLYVGNLDYEVTEGDLYDLFTGAGTVKNAEVVCHRHTQRSKGYAFVEMANVDEARRAADKLHDEEFMGRKLSVTGAKSGGPKGGDATDQDEVDEEEAA